MDISNDQFIYVAIFLVAMLLASYLITIAKNITLVVITLMGTAYILTNNSHDISISHATDWMEEKSQVTGDAAKQIFDHAKAIDIQSAKDQLEKGREFMSGEGI